MRASSPSEAFKTIATERPQTDKMAEESSLSEKAGLQTFDAHSSIPPRSSLSPEQKPEHGTTPTSENQAEDGQGSLRAKGKILRGKKLLLAFVGMLMSILLIALDQTILSPALPVIASNFKALDQIGWIASAYVSFLSVQFHPVRIHWDVLIPRFSAVYHSSLISSALCPILDDL